MERSEEDSIRLSLISAVHTRKQTLVGNFRRSARVSDVLTFFLGGSPDLLKDEYVLLHDKSRAVLRPESTLLDVYGNSNQQQQVVLSVRQETPPSKRLDFIILIGISFFLGLTTLIFGLPMYLTNGWSSLDGQLSVINAHAGGTELSLFSSGEEIAPTFSCTINSSTGISSLLHKDSEIILGYLTDSHCFNKTLSSSVFLGATEGLFELNRSHPCLADELLGKVRQTLKSLVPRGSVEMIPPLDTGVLAWRSLNHKGGNRTVSEWGRFSLQIAYSTTDLARAYKNVTLRNGEKVPVVSKTFKCLGDSWSWIRYLASLYYQTYKIWGHMPQEIHDPCLSTKGINHSLATLFTNPCTKELLDQGFSKKVKESLDSNINFVPGYTQLNSCAAKIRDTLSDCQNIFKGFCYSELGVSNLTIHALRGRFSVLQKELSLRHSPTEEDWNEGLSKACDSAKSKDLCFRGNFIKNLFNKNSIAFEDLIQWPLGYADEFFSVGEPKDPFTTISASGFALLSILSVSFFSVGSFFTHQYLNMC